MKIFFIFLAMIVTSLVSYNAQASYTDFTKVEWVKTTTSFIAFRNIDGSKLGVSTSCPNAVEMKWTLAEASDYYKRVMTFLMTASSTGKKVRAWQCACEDNGTVIKACDVEMR